MNYKPINLAYSRGWSKDLVRKSNKKIIQTEREEYCNECMTTHPKDKHRI